ncbi:hypothetical protein VP01_322g4 [Puccinia sorghi]|uniref:Uncharacterized protein n=1 Tax=Puccinia sorghi TaxID=27349 RepID=A0A0L6UYA4_9BASI|nr:hypothetical protein VP01_322g4 [Puccinia sorghi]
MFPTHLLDSTVEFAALFLWAEEHDKPVEHRYIRDRRHAFKPKQFHQLFRMRLEDFRWLASILREELEQDLLRRGNPLTVEAHVGVGLYRLAHGCTYVTIGHVFNIWTETTDKVF